VPARCNAPYAGSTCGRDRPGSFWYRRRCRSACSRSICSQRRSTNSAARRPCVTVTPTVVPHHVDQPCDLALGEFLPRAVFGVWFAPGQSGWRRSHCALFVVRGNQSQVRSGGHFHVLRLGNCAFYGRSIRSRPTIICCYYGRDLANPFPVNSLF
jgi:hypothetical protein